MITEQKPYVHSYYLFLIGGWFVWELGSKFRRGSNLWVGRPLLFESMQVQLHQVNNHFLNSNFTLNSSPLPCSGIIQFAQCPWLFGFIWTGSRKKGINWHQITGNSILYSQASKPTQMFLGDLYHSRSPEAISIISKYPSMICRHLEFRKT